MTVAATDLADYVGAPDADDQYVDDCLATAGKMVADHVARSPLVADDGSTVEVPDEITDRAVLEVGSELYHRRNAPQGVAQFAALDGAPVRIARDPMVAARPILAPYLGGGFG